MLHRLVPFMSLAAVAVVATPSAAQNDCDAGKLKCIRQKLGCLIKVHEKSQKKGQPPDAGKLQKCMDKFDGGDDPTRGCFAKVEAKAANVGEACSTVGNVASIEAQADQVVQDFVAALDIAVPTTTTSSTTTSTIGVPCGPTGGGNCAGDCPPGQECIIDAGSCTCGESTTTTTSLPLCSSSTYPSCGGTCPTGQTCAATTLGGDVGVIFEGCLCVPENQPCGSVGSCAVPAPPTSPTSSCVADFSDFETLCSDVIGYCADGEVCVLDLGLGFCFSPDDGYQLIDARGCFGG